MVISETTVRPTDGAVEHPWMDKCHGSPISQRFHSHLVTRWIKITNL